MPIISMNEKDNAKQEHVRLKCDEFSKYNYFIVFYWQLSIIFVNKNRKTFNRIQV